MADAPLPGVSKEGEARKERMKNSLATLVEK